jgi:hypothetical protein
VATSASEHDNGQVAIAADPSEQFLLLHCTFWI